MAKRGELTPEIQERAKAFLDREISQTELRLYPYIHYCATNERKIKPEKINEEERQIMRLWKDAGHFEGGMSGINMTKEFFNFMNDMLWYGYFIYDN